MSDWNEKVIRQFRENAGEVEGFGRRLVLLHDRGARSGTEYVHPVAAIRDEDGWLVAASAAGSDHHPAWYRNLLAHPDIELETPDGTVAVHAEDLPRAERDLAWSRFTAMSEGFRSYEAKTTRVIPVLRLTPR
ncbi:MAG: nitroreductase family deazaflavin-dependent oxidoreductase [Micrococcales bacterium]|nr:nitroreductase family deazaflavin-dependent oxidoreductase [Micrococcales bacterium]